jgi:serine/threonine protein phosphatase PrpC
MSSLLKAMADTFDKMTAAGTGRVGEFNTGCYEEIGNRPTLEDRVVAKELHVKALKKRGVERVTFFAVYDGHGGQEASIYLHKHLHSHIEKALDSKEVASAYTKDAGGDAMITRILAEEYPKVDAEFFAKHKAKAMAAGSTAATLLVLDDRIFAANVGDSRVLLSRAGTSICLTEDHKPSLPTEKERIKSRGG